MQFDPAEIGPSAVYKLLTGTIIPRPIGWISSVDANGIANLAPFSFFNAVSEDPPHVMFSTVRPGGQNKDTLANVLATGEFVVNLVTEETVEAMNASSANFPSHVSEFDALSIASLPSTLISPPRVAASPVHLECRLVHHYPIGNHETGGATVVIGEVLRFHIHDAILKESFHIDLDQYRPVARLAGSNYATLGTIFSLKRPTL